MSWKAHSPAAVTAADEPEKIIAARVGNGGGIVIGYGQDEMFLASDLPAISSYARAAVFLKNGELALVEPDGARYFDQSGVQLSRVPAPVSGRQHGFCQGRLQALYAQGDNGAAGVAHQPAPGTDQLRPRRHPSPPN